MTVQTSYTAFATTATIIMNRISRDGKMRLVLVQDEKNANRYKFALVDIRQDTMRFMEPSFKDMSNATTPTIQRIYRGWNGCMSRLLFVTLSRSPEKLALVHNRDVDGLAEASELFGYAMEFNKYIKRSQFEGTIPSTLENNTGLPLRYVWESTHLPQFGNVKLFVERTLMHNPKVEGYTGTRAYMTCKFMLRTKDLVKFEKFGSITIERNFPVEAWPKLTDFMAEPQVSGILDAWLSDYATV